MQWRVVGERLVRRSTYLRKINRVIGFGLLAAYLAWSGDFSFSPLWASGMVVGAIFLGGVVASPRLHERFPELDCYALARRRNPPTAGALLSHDQWLTQKTQFTISGMQGTAILGTPGEDGFICVPVLLAGINPISAIVGGACFWLPAPRALDLSRLDRKSHLVYARLSLGVAPRSAHRCGWTHCDRCHRPNGVEADHVKAAQDRQNYKGPDWLSPIFYNGLNNF